LFQDPTLLPASSLRSVSGCAPLIHSTLLLLCFSRRHSCCGLPLALLLRFSHCCLLPLALLRTPCMRVRFDIGGPRARIPQYQPGRLVRKVRRRPPRDPLGRVRADWYEGVWPVGAANELECR